MEVKAVYTENGHRSHDPQFFWCAASSGAPRQPERADRCSGVCGRIARQNHRADRRLPRDARAVHSAEYLRFLAEAWDEMVGAWRCGAGDDRQHPPVRPAATYPTSIVGKLGWTRMIGVSIGGGGTGQPGRRLRGRVRGR